MKPFIGLVVSFVSFAMTTGCTPTGGTAGTSAYAFARNTQSAASSTKQSPNRKGDAEETDNCKTEFDEYCPNQRPPGVLTCIETNFGKFSTTCQNELEDRETKREAVNTACKTDKEAFCDNVAEKNIPDCLRTAHEQKKLSEDCDAALEANRPPGRPPHGRG